jgi:hypothetical protein
MSVAYSDNNRIDSATDLLPWAADSRPSIRQTTSHPAIPQADKGRTGTSVHNLIVAGISDQTGIEKQLYLLPASMARFLLRQAKIGHCPPIPILRILGLRTEKELASDAHNLNLS